LRESLPEIIKNILLVVQASRAMDSNKKFWAKTWELLDPIVPSIRDEIGEASMTAPDVPANTEIESQEPAFLNVPENTESEFQESAALNVPANSEMESQKPAIEMTEEEDAAIEPLPNNFNVTDI
jgi:hypothetical protein